MYERRILKMNVILFLIFSFMLFWGFQSCSMAWTDINSKAVLSYSQLVSEVNNGNIRKISIDSQTGYIEGSFYRPVAENKISFRSQISITVLESLLDKIDASEPRPEKIEFSVASPLWGLFTTTILPLAILALIFWFVIRRTQSGPRGNPFTFSRSLAKLVSSDRRKVTFNDVAGVDEAKEELRELVEFLRNPSKFLRLGGRIPKGVLLVGSPGTGKTLLARAVAGEANVPFFSTTGADFVEMFVGVGASRVRDLFAQGVNKAPCIIFIDEIDAIGSRRGGFGGGGHEEREQTLNQILAEMDGFENTSGVIVMAATNMPEVLDPALLRPGRFDRHVVVEKPDIKGRAQILAIHLRRTPLARDTDLSVIARGTPGFSGAELEKLVNEAALNAARHNRDSVTLEDLEFAKDKVLMGPERRSRVISADEKKLVAFHEAGHAIIAASLPPNETDPLHKVTIVSRGMTGGSTWQLPIEEKGIQDKKYLLNQLIILMGGRAAEEVGLGTCSTGASNDIEVATNIARNMICEWGMSDLGKIKLGINSPGIYLGRKETRKDYSEYTARKIDEKIKEFLDTAYDQARTMIEDNRNKLALIVKELIERETLSGEEVRNILNQKGS